MEVLEGVDQPALHVAGPARPHGRVDQTLPPSHGVEEVFRRRQAALVVRGDESAGVGAQVAAAIVRQRPVEESPHEALAPDGLLPDGAGHLRQVEHRPARAGPGENDSRVLETELTAGDLPRVVAGAAQLAPDQHFEGFLEGPAGLLVELALAVLLNELVDLGARGRQHVVDLLAGVLGHILVVDAGGEAPEVDRGDREAARLIEELPRPAHAVVAGDGVQQGALLERDGLLVDRAGLELAAVDNDPGVVRAVQGRIRALVPDVGPVLHREVLGDQRREQLLPRPELSAVLVGPGRRRGRHLDPGEHVRHLVAVEVGVLVGQEEHPGDVVVEHPDDRSAVARREDVFLDLHQDLRLGAGLLALEHVEVHLVAIEIRVVGRAVAEIEPERLVRKDPDEVGHHAHPVEGGLPVEQHDVAVDQLPFHDAARRDELGAGLGVLVHDLDPLAVLADQVVHAALVDPVLIGRRRTPLDELFREVGVVGRDLERDRQRATDLGRDADLVDRQHRVGRDDRPRGEIDPLTGEVRPEPAVLSLEPLGERLERAAGPVPGRRDAAGLVIEVGRNVILEQFPQVLDDELGRAHVAVLAESLVDPEDVDQLVGEVVFTAFPALERDGRADLDRRDRQHGQDHPLGPAGLRIEPKGADIVVRDPLQASADLFGGDLVAVLPEGGGLVEDDPLLDLVAVGAAAFLLPLARDRRGDGPVVALDGDLGAARARAFGQHAPAGAAGQLEEPLDLLRVADVDDRHGELDDTEVARALIDTAAAGPASQVGLDHAEVEVHEPHLDRVAVVVVRVGRDHLHSVHATDLVRREESELEALDPLRKSLCHGGTPYRMSSNWSRMITPRLISSSRSSLNE